LFDAYNFRDCGKLGYIAFFYNEKQKLWTIKSFHVCDTSNTAIKDALERAGLLEDKQHETKRGL